MRLDIPQVRIEILKMEPDMQQLPLKVIAVFDGFFRAENYNGCYKRNARGGLQFFIYKGFGRLNKRYKIEIELYYDEINITVTKYPGFWVSLWRSICLVFGVVFGVFLIFGWVWVLIDGDVVSGGGVSGGSVRDKAGISERRKKGKLPESFTLKYISRITGNMQKLDDVFNTGNYDEVLLAHRAFFEQHLMPAIRGVQWVA